MQRILNPLSLIFVDFLFIKFPGRSWGTEIRLGLYLSRERYTTLQPPPYVFSTLLLILPRYSQIFFYWLCFKVLPTPKGQLIAQPVLHIVQRGRKSVVKTHPKPQDKCGLDISQESNSWLGAAFPLTILRLFWLFFFLKSQKTQLTLFTFVIYGSSSLTRESREAEFYPRMLHHFRQFTVKLVN